MKKFCTKCGKPFEAIGREVICPSCKQAAAEEVKRAAVLRAKRASWSGESVPVRISGRASTIIRRYGASNNLQFAESLDALLKASDYFTKLNTKWEDITPYKSHRRDKSASTAQDVQEQDGKQDTPQEVKPQEVKQTAQVAKKATKTSTAKKATRAASVKK